MGTDQRMGSGNALPRAITALTARLRERIGAGAFMPDRAEYVSDLRDNLVPGVVPELFEAELRQGDGAELDGKNGKPPKFKAAFSSSALGVNAFAPWKRSPETLWLSGVRGFENIAFEKKCPNGLKTNRPPNLDVFARAGDHVVAVESKCTEFLRGKVAKFAAQYEQAVANLFEPQWTAIYRDLVADPRAYRWLDAAQLVKHYLGLRHSHGRDRVRLLYLFWEPANADDLEVFGAHREEIRSFASTVEGSAVEFKAMSYPDLWREWDRLPGPDWLPGHLSNLRARYETEI
jgi:hypothetical protein